MNNLKKFGNLLASDFYKAGRLKSVYIAPVIMFLLILINYSLLWINNSMLDGATIPEGVTLLMTGRSMFFGASSYINLGLFMAIICGIFIGGDFKDGTIKLAVARGSDRFAVYFSKWLVMVTIAIGYVLGAVLVCGLFSSASYGTAVDGAEFALIIRTIALQCLVATASASVYVCIAFLARSQGSTIGISLAVYFIISIVAAILILISTLTEQEWLTTITEFAPSQQLTNACSSEALTTAQKLKVSFVPICYTLVLGAIGSFSFFKRDIK